MFLKVVPTTCMEKNLLNREPYTSPLLNKQSILKNETFAFQVALKVDLYVSPMLSQEINTPKVVKGDGDIKVYEVKNIPSRLSRLNRIDGGYEDNGKGGLYPDCLNLLNDGDSVVVSSVYWNSIYVEFTPNETTKIGNNEITVEFYKEDKKEEERIKVDYMKIKLHEVLESMYIAFRTYHTIRRYADFRGTNIINITPDSYIDAFQKAKL